MARVNRSEVVRGMSEETERRCQRCGIVQPIAMFYVEQERKRAAREGRTKFNYPCRTCNQETSRARRKPRQDYADAIKLERGCSVCGLRSEHPEVFDFDHGESEKVSSIALMLTRGTWEQFTAEIEKCEVVCANCHRILTRARTHRGFGKSRA